MAQGLKNRWICKTWESFSKVISVKIDGWRALIDALDCDLSHLRVLCAFTSIAGRFGNGGQVTMLQPTTFSMQKCAGFPSP